MFSPLLPMVGFGAAVLPVCLIPGVSFTLVIDRALTRDLAAANKVTIGTIAGLFTHALLAAAGLSAIVMRSAEAFTAVKLIGAAYLIGLGAWMLIAAARSSGAQRTPARMPWYRGGDFAQGYFGNVLNPKAAAVYLTLAPQFVDPAVPLLGQMLALWLAHAIVAGGWLTILAVAMRSMRRRINLSQFSARLTAIGGVVMIGLGIRTAATR